MKTQLEIGDVLYDYSRWQGLQRYVVDRVTDKTAFKGDSYKWKRELQHGEARWIGDYGTAKLETEELKHKFMMQQLNNKAQSLHRTFYLHDDYTEEQLREMIAFFSKYQKHETQ